MRLSISSLRAKSLVAIVACAMGVGALAPVRADETVRAVWQVQEIHLPYFGLTTHYSCDGLRDKMREILNELGVREDFLLRMACASITGPERLPSATMVLATAVPADDEIAKTFAADPKRAELLGRMRDKAKSKADYGDEPFDAVLKRVTLRAKESASPGASGDCELLEHVRRYVLPKIGAKIVRDEIRCTPHQGIVGNPVLEVDVLVAVPAKP